MSWRATGCAASCGTRKGSWNRRSNISCWHWREEAIFPKTSDGGSTFTYAAHLALHTGRQVRAPIDIEVLEHQLHEWLGEDWKELVENPSMRQAKARRKRRYFQLKENLINI